MRPLNRIVATEASRQRRGALPSPASAGVGMQSGMLTRRRRVVRAWPPPTQAEPSAYRLSRFVVAAGLFVVLGGCGRAASGTSNPSGASDSQSVAQQEAIAPAPAHTNWPMFRGNPEQTGVAGEPLPENLVLLWKYETGDSIESTAAIVDGIVYIGTVSGIMYAIGLEQGDLRWKYDGEGDGGFKASPCVVNGAVYVGDDFGLFHAIDAETGKKRWTFATTSEIMSSTNYVDGKVLFGSYDANLYCLSAETGEEVWKFTTQTSVHSTPAVAGDRVFIAGCDDVLRSVSLKDAKELAQVPLGAPSQASAAVSGNQLFDGTFANEIVAIDLETNQRVWTYNPPDHDQPFYASAAVGTDRIVVGGRDKLVYCLKRDTGEVVWTFPTNGRVDSSAVIAGGRVYFGSHDGNVYGLDLETGEEVWRFTLGERITASPAVADGRLVIGSEDGILYCFGAK